MAPSEETPLKFRSFPGEPRLLWNPAAHEVVGERCSFFLLTASDSLGAAMTEALKDIMDRLSIHGATTHILYGVDDVLIRVWLTAERRRAFLRAIQSPNSGLKLEEFLEFRALEVFYDEHDQSIQAPEATLFSRLEEIIASFRKTQSDNADRGRLVKKALRDRILIPFVSQVGVKVYLFLYTKQESVPRPDLAILSNIAHEAGFKSVSAYGGRGFCDAIIKGVLGQYHETLPAVQSVQAAIANLGYYSWTQVPADYGQNREGETLHLPDSSVEKILETLRGNSQGEGRLDDADPKRAMDTLQDEQVRHSVKNILKYASDKLRTQREQERLESILYAVLTADRRTLNKRLSFLISIESNLRDLFELIAVRYGLDISHFTVSLDEVHDSSAISRYQAALQSGSIQEILRSTDLPILFAILGKFTILLSGYEELLNIRELEDLPVADWVDGAREFIELRNAYAHGLLLDSVLDYNFSENFWEEMRRVVDAISMQIALENQVLSMRQ